MKGLNFCIWYIHASLPFALLPENYARIMKIRLTGLLASIRRAFTLASVQSSGIVKNPSIASEDSNGVRG